MNSRITLVSLLDHKNLQKIEQLLVDVTDPLCKVPFGKGVNDRVVNDTLPYHFTIFSWNIDIEDEVISFLKSLDFSPFKILVNEVEIVEGNEGSFDLRLSIRKTKELVDIQKRIFERYSSKYYIPEVFSFHFTIHIDQDYQKVLKIKEKVNNRFSPFELEIKALGLFEIYPAKLVEKIDL